MAGPHAPTPSRRFAPGSRSHAGAHLQDARCATPSPSIQERPAQRPVPPTPKPPAPGPAFSPRPGQPLLLSIGSWAFHKIPNGWQIQEGLGIQQDVKDAFPASVGAMEERLGPGITLPQYVEAQTKMFREYLREPKIDAALPPAIPGSAETVCPRSPLQHQGWPVHMLPPHLRPQRIHHRRPNAHHHGEGSPLRPPRLRFCPLGHFLLAQGLSPRFLRMVVVPRARKQQYRVKRGNSSTALIPS